MRDYRVRSTPPTPPPPPPPTPEPLSVESQRYNEEEALGKLFEALVQHGLLHQDDALLLYNLFYDTFNMGDGNEPPLNSI